MISINVQQHKPLRELVYDQLRMLIMTGSIKPGTRMMEIELAESMGVSRTPVREAIRQLEKDGLVTIEARRGAYVSDISPDDFDSMMMVREPLEGLAAYLATLNMSEDQIAELRTAAARCKEAIEHGTQEELSDADQKFHDLINQGSGNRYLISLCHDLQEKVTRFRYIYFKSSKRAQDITEEHDTILDAIEKRDAEAARECTIQHIENLRQTIKNEEDFRPIG